VHGVKTNDDATSDCWAARAAPWSASARGRLGWARRVAPKESDVSSPHFKMSTSNLRIPTFAGKHTNPRGSATGRTAANDDISTQTPTPPDANATDRGPVQSIVGEGKRRRVSQLKRRRSCGPRFGRFDDSGDTRSALRQSSCDSGTNWLPRYSLCNNNIARRAAAAR